MHYYNSQEKVSSLCSTLEQISHQLVSCCTIALPHSNIGATVALQH